MMKLSMINEQVSKIEEVAKAREEQIMKFAKQTEAKLNSKMEVIEENRNALITNMVEKLKKTDEKIIQIKEVTNKSVAELDEKIKSKLTAAEENRLEQLSLKKEKLKEKKHMRKTSQNNDSQHECNNE